MLEDVAQLNRRFASLSPVQLLSWASEHFGGGISFGTGFGVEGCTIVHMIGTCRMNVDLFTLDTGLFFDETYELWERLEERYGVRIRAIKPKLTVEQQNDRHGPSLWRRQPDLCCKLRKVDPLQRDLHGREAWVTAIRREQSPARAHAERVEREPRFGVIKINPLVHWTNDDVWQYIRRHDIPHNPLHHRGYPSIGCHPCTSPVKPGEDPRAGRWRGFGKTECGLHGRFAGASARSSASE